MWEKGRKKIKTNNCTDEENILEKNMHIDLHDFWKKLLYKNSVEVSELCKVQLLSLNYWGVLPISTAASTYLIINGNSTLNIFNLKFLQKRREQPWVATYSSIALWAGLRNIINLHKFGHHSKTGPSLVDNLKLHSWIKCSFVERHSRNNTRKTNEKKDRYERSCSE